MTDAGVCLILISKTGKLELTKGTILDRAGNPMTKKHHHSFGCKYQPKRCHGANLAWRFYS